MNGRRTTGSADILPTGVRVVWDRTGKETAGRGLPASLYRMATDGFAGVRARKAGLATMVRCRTEVAV
ncbi:hypothetical protein [Roseibium aggregatum]|uniref:hypothetical protein n=1 Tax=Roseibium aggregatum TaxID=187304 RepID=UPI0025AC8F5D|nr:hypothetical protein [Roseibium aggregatum]WJS01376.1 hypothetical protein QUB73_19665 [Roseibium aggregatum]